MLRRADSPTTTLLREAGRDFPAMDLSKAKGVIYGLAIGDAQRWAKRLTAPPRKAAVPEIWLRGHPGRTSYSDDGRVFELLREAGKLWG
jgi:hypothetical protein